MAPASADQAAHARRHSSLLGHAPGKVWSERPRGGFVGGGLAVGSHRVVAAEGATVNPLDEAHLQRASGLKLRALSARAQGDDGAVLAARLDGPADPLTPRRYADPPRAATWGSP